MKKLLVFTALLTTQFVGMANAAPFLADYKAKSISTDRIGGSTAAKPICICSFDPDTGNWTCIPRGCWLTPQPDVGLKEKLHTQTLPNPDYSQPRTTFPR